MAADVFVKHPFSLCLLSFLLVPFSLLRHQPGLMTYINLSFGLNFVETAS